MATMNHTLKVPQMVTNQHFHSARFIKKFCCKDGLVDIKLKNNGYSYRRGVRSKIFTTKGTWDQKSELGYMRLVEDQFHNEIKENKGFLNRNHKLITRYWLLWHIRFNFHKCPPQTENFDLTPTALNEDDRQFLDRMGIFYVDDDGVFSSRSVAGIQILGYLNFYMDRHIDLKWGLLETSDGEFLVADCYRNLGYMPISPKLALMENTQDQIVSSQQVRELNEASINRASDFYFARRLDQCPSALEF